MEVLLDKAGVIGRLQVLSPGERGPPYPVPVPVGTNFVEGRLLGDPPGEQQVLGTGKLRAETRAKVLAAADQLSFRPSPLARGLLTGRSYIVGLITSESFGRFTIPVMLGAEDALVPGQMSVVLCDSRGDPIREDHYVRALLSRKVDGVIVTGKRTDPRPPLATDLPVPVVYVMTQSENPADLSLIPDDRQGGELAARHLVATGRTRIAHITGPERFLSARLRAAGARQVLAEAGLPLAAGDTLHGE